MLRRERVDGDGRGLYAAITDEGEALLRRMWPTYARSIRATFVDTIEPGDAARIAQSLSRASDAAQLRDRPASLARGRSRR
jgi:DNA-binding MarR family transcriptional regulator